MEGGDQLAPPGEIGLVDHDLRVGPRKAREAANKKAAATELCEHHQPLKDMVMIFILVIVTLIKRKFSPSADRQYRSGSGDRIGTKASRAPYAQLTPARRPNRGPSARRDRVSSHAPTARSNPVRPALS